MREVGAVLGDFGFASSRTRTLSYRFCFQLLLLHPAATKVWTQTQRTSLPLEAERCEAAEYSFVSIRCDQKHLKRIWREPTLRILV